MDRSGRRARRPDVVSASELAEMGVCENTPATEQLKDLLALAKEHEGAGEFEEARHTWLCAQELVRKHPELGGLLDEAMLAGKN